MNVLVIDIGGSSIKVAVAHAAQSGRLPSDSTLGPDALVEKIRRTTAPWRFDRVSIGVPSRVNANGLVAEPGNLGSGWIGFDFERALGAPVRIVNDAVMQALGAYDGGRMLFLGLGAGVGSALVTEGVVVPLELGDLPFGNSTIAQHLGRDAFERDGLDRWRAAVASIVPPLRHACVADYVVIGGGNATHVDPLPADSRRGGNDDAVEGGWRLWREIVEPHDRPPSPFWRVVA